MKITQNFITNPICRPYRPLKEVRGIVVHYIGVPCTKASVIRNNFQRSTVAASSQFIVDYTSGEVVEAIPRKEVAYHVGAKTYTAQKESICKQENPNNYLIGIECCIDTEPLPRDFWDRGKYPQLARPSATQKEALVLLLARLCREFGLDPLTQIYRHFDITGKACHLYYYKNEGAFLDLKREVKAQMGNYYDKAVLWAREAGLVQGDDKGDLGLLRPILKCDLLVILQRFYQMMEK